MAHINCCACPCPLNDLQSSEAEGAGLVVGCVPLSDITALSIIGHEGQILCGRHIKDLMLFLFINFYLVEDAETGVTAYNSFPPPPPTSSPSLSLASPS